MVHKEQQKKRDPRSQTNFVSRILLWWIGGLLRHGFRHELQQSDLYAHPSEADSAFLYQKFNRYWNEELDKLSNGGTPRLWFVILKSFWWRFLLHGLIMLILLSASTAQALLLGLLARYFSLPCEQRTDAETMNAYLFGTGVVFLGLCRAFIQAHGFLVGEKIGMLTRIMMTSALYGKVLTLSQVAIGKLTTGHIVNLASNDVYRYDYAFLFVHHIWIAPLQLIVSISLIYQQIGWVSLVLCTLIVIAVPLLALLARIFSSFRFKSAKLTDHRIRIMNEVLTGIRVIKMYAWEYAFRRVVQQLRKWEINLITIGGVLRILSVSFIMEESLFSCLEQLS